MYYNAAKQLERLGSFEALVRADTPEKITALVEAGAKVNVRGDIYKFEKTPLMFVNKLEIAESLLRYGADISAVDSFGRTAFHYADSKGIAEFLVQCGADVNAVDRFGRTALYYANSKEMIDFLLLICGCDINARDSDGKTPLLYYVETDRSVDHISSLLKAGSNINVRGNNGYSVMDIALSVYSDYYYRYGDDRCVTIELLKKVGA